MKPTVLAKMCLYVLSASLLTSACLNTESDYNDLTAQVAGLNAELETARRQNEILTAALANITQEKERLTAALETYEPAPAAGGAAGAVALAGDRDGLPGDGAAASPAPGGRVHVAQPGDTLSNIAVRYNTDVNTLMALNPYLRGRNQNMVWENDNIQLP